jgi:hypothetical protein
MKRIYNLLALALIFALSSCTEDPIGVDKLNNDDTTAPGKITNIDHLSDYGSLVFTWTSPNDADFLYTDVLYEIEGEKYSKKISKFSVDSTVIDGLDNASYNFTFYAVDGAGNRSEGVTYTASSLEAPNKVVANTVGVESNEMGGIIVSWQNVTGKIVNVEVSYISDEGERKIQTFTSDEASFSGEVKDGLSEPTDGKEFSVTVKDNKGKVALERKFSVALYEYLKIPRDNWVFPGYQDDSQDETAGYSSQATNEGASPNGRVTAMLDGNTATYWHARWGSPAASYPHWFIVDMRQSVLIREIELQRRQGNGGTAKGFRLYTCKDIPVDTSNPVDGYTWEDQGEYSFNPAINDAQKIKIDNSPVARYVKLYFDTHHKGTGDYAMFAEFAVWGQREKE